MRITPRPHLVSFVLSITLATACQEGAGSDPDASASEGEDASADLPDAATGTPDAATDTPDASTGTPDAALPGDAAPPLDGGGGSLGAACTALCDSGTQCGEDVPPDCQTQCEQGLSTLGCSESELTDLIDCTQLACDQIESCVESIPCFDGGGGGGCGDGTCDPSETCGTCSADCGACVCGDGVCSLGECASCESDCPNGCHCDDICQTGPAQDPSCGSCQADICAADPYCCQTEWDAVCVDQAETICGKDCPAFCGDFNCDPNEDAQSCPEDCGAVPPPPPSP